MTRPDSTLRTLAIAARLLLVLTVVLGVLYPLLITGVGRLALESRANGSLVRDRSGSVVGSRLIGQSFTDADGNPLPQYFQPRPSAAAEGYDAAASGGSNLGPESARLIKARPGPVRRSRRTECVVGRAPRFRGVDSTWRSVRTASSNRP